MARRFVFVLAAALSLCGCCREPGSFSPHSVRAVSNWDGLAPAPDQGRMPRRHGDIGGARARAIDAQQIAAEADPFDEDPSKLRRYSKEWVAAFDASNRAADERLNKKLVICRGCLSPEINDPTGSIVSR